MSTELKRPTIVADPVFQLSVSLLPPRCHFIATTGGGKGRERHWMQSGIIEETIRRKMGVERYSKRETGIIKEQTAREAE